MMILISLLLIAISGCADISQERVSKQHYAMGTVITITAFDVKDEAVLDSCTQYMDSLEHEVSVNLPDSQIARLNSAGGGRLTGDAAQILQIAQQAAQSSHGAFDYSILPLRQLWDVENRKDGDSPPTTAELAAAREFVGYGRIKTSDTDDALEVTLPPGMGVDLGGIAKGYAGDKCAQFLRDAGISRAIIDIGGNVRTLGSEEFNIGLRHPRGQAEDLFAVLTTGETNVITSGDYERFFETDGIRYHHIFDPATGESARSGLISTTVVGPDGATADALSTALFVMGLPGLELAQQLGYEAIAVTESYEVYATPGVIERLEIVDDSFHLASP